MIERKAFISNVQKYNMYDGPGVRTLIFFKGCPLRCKWCSNPETWERNYKVMYREDACINCGACVPVCPAGIHSISKITGRHEIDRSKECIGCRKCEEVCTQSALSISGEIRTISELMQIIEEDRTFYELSGGGVTIGGGDSITQPDALASLLMACKQEGINTAMETAGYAKMETLLQVAGFVDLFLFDLKHIDSDRHYEMTGVRNEQILKNLKELLHRRYNVKVRMPILKGINDSQKDIEGVIKFLMPFKDYKNFKGIDLLPYHKFGVNKYKQLGMEYPMKDFPDPTLSREDMARIESWISKYNFPAAVINH